MRPVSPSVLDWSTPSSRTFSRNNFSNFAATGPWLPASRIRFTRDVCGDGSVLWPMPWRIEMDTEQREVLIARYRDGHRVVMEALKGIAADELDRSASGEWTPRETAHPLADSEMMSA